MSEQVYLSRKDLRERGWSKGQIKRLLPGHLKPDRLGEPARQGEFPVPLFSLERIETLEAEHGIPVKRPHVEAVAARPASEPAKGDGVVPPNPRDNRRTARERRGGQLLGRIAPLGRRVP